MAPPAGRARRACAFHAAPGPPPPDRRRPLGESTDPPHRPRADQHRPLPPQPVPLPPPTSTSLATPDHHNPQARLDALSWALRNPRHDRRSRPVASPPFEPMESLVGRAIEVLWPAEQSWYKALVQVCVGL